jgi:predicted MFS family arabinose efflux permease
MPKLVNKIVKVLILSDLFLNLGWGLLSPIFALFILQNITIGNPEKAAEVAGLAALFYWISKSFIEIPIGRFLDKHDGEKDDFWFMLLGEVLITLVPIGYLFSSYPWQIYLCQILHAVGMAMALPSWLAIFTRHIDKGKEAFEWSMETTSIGIGAGIAGGLGGILVAILGFKGLFFLVSGLNLFAALLLLLVKNNVSKRGDSFIAPPERPVVEP